MTRSYPWSISLIVPALNEERVLHTVLAQIIREVKGRVRDYELILIDDGSTDATRSIMDSIASAEPNVRVVHNPQNLGLGACYHNAVREAKHEYVMLLCGDGGFPASSLPPVFDAIATADIVVPYIVNLRQIKSPLRYLLSRSYTGLLNLLFGLELNYYNGLPVHRADLLRKIEITSAGFGFQGEILVKLLKSGCSFVQVGVRGAEETKRSFALRPWNVLSVARTLLHLLWEISRFRPITVDALEPRRLESHYELRRELLEEHASSPSGRRLS